MDKRNLEEYLKDILEQVEKVVELQDEQAIEDLTSYIYISKDIIRYYKITEGNSATAEKAYCKINEAEEKLMRISKTTPKKGVSPFDITEIFNTFVEGLNIFSRG